MRLSSFVKSDVSITIGKNLLALSILQEINEVATISTHSMLINTLSVLAIETPFTFIKISFRRFPYSEPILSAILP